MSHEDPTTVDQLVELIKRYTVVEDPPGVVRPTAVPRKEALPDHGTCIPASSALDLWSSTPVNKIGDIQCWWCRSWGYTQAQCSLQEEPVEYRACMFLCTKSMYHPSCPGCRSVCVQSLSEPPSHQDSTGLRQLGHAGTCQGDQETFVW